MLLSKAQFVTAVLHCDNAVDCSCSVVVFEGQLVHVLPELDCLYLPKAHEQQCPLLVCWLFVTLQWSELEIEL